MAAIEDKNMKFDSQMILLTTNLHEMKFDKYLSEPRALERRLHMWYQMRPKVEFRDPKVTINEPNGTWAIGLDKSKIQIDAPMDMNMYEFQDNRTGKVIGYEELVDEAVKLYRSKQNSIAS